MISRTGGARLAKVIEIATPSDSRAYRDALAATRSNLRMMSGAIFHDAVQVALARAWQTWGSEQPIGSTINFCIEDFDGIADPRVAALAQLYRHIQEAMDVPGLRRPL